MLNARGLVVAGLGGVLGAVLVAVLVLGRPAPSEVLALADLDDGGVLAIRAEIYQRHGPKAEQITSRVEDGGIGLFPERRVDETWGLLASDGEIIEVVTVTWTTDGGVFQRVRLTSEAMVTERPAHGVREQEPPPGGGPGTFGPPSELRADAEAEIEERLASGEWAEVPAPLGSIRMEHRRTIDPGELGPGLSVPFFGDLDAVEMVIVLTTNIEQFAGSEERFVVLEDGSRVLVESRHTTLEARTRADWDAFVARVWGE